MLNASSAKSPPGEIGGVADRCDDGAVAVAVRLAGHPFVGAGEFLRAVVQALLGDFPGGRVDDPPVQGQRPVPGQGGHVVGACVPDQVDHDPAVVVVGVEGVEDPARVHLEPADPGRGVPAGQQADPGLVRGVPGVGQLQPGRYRVQAEGDRQVEQHHVASAVSAKSCIIGPPGTGMSVVRLTVPSAPMITCWTWSQAQK